MTDKRCKHNLTMRTCSHCKKRARPGRKGWVFRKANWTTFCWNCRGWIEPGDSIKRRAWRTVGGWQHTECEEAFFDGPTSMMGTPDSTEFQTRANQLAAERWRDFQPDEGAPLAPGKWLETLKREEREEDNG